MKTRITIGVDNIPDSGLKEEWGLSLYIEYGEKSILLDAGASDLFIDSASSSTFFRLSSEISKL